jgi:ABC-type Zn uptake system ZnuABC Zn-binding protein ZnuA
MLARIVWQRWTGLVLIAGLLAACGTANTNRSTTNPSGAGPQGTAPRSSGGAAATDSAVKVIATTSIIADLVQNVGGDRVNVRTLLSPETDPHTYSPTPSDVQGIAESEIVFENGLGLEAWLTEVMQNAGGSRPMITVSQGLTPIVSGADEHGDEQHADDTKTDHVAGGTATAQTTPQHADEAQSDGDPHMWFDVQHAIRYVENIRDGLKQVDPAGATIYDANAAAYIEQLNQLDAEIIKLAAMVPTERRKLITNHDNFGYFANRYGFEVVGHVFQSVSTDQEPSAQQIVQLVRLIKEQQVPAVFTENTVNPRLAEQVANEAGVKVVTTLYTDALGPAGSNGETYIKMMRYNAQQIVEALK